MKLYSPDIFILDDGFQHRRMPRDINILLLDYANPISTGFVFPFGYLRQFPSAISKADVVVFTRATDTTIPKKVERYCKDKPLFFSNTYYNSFSNGDKSFPLDYIKGKSVYLFSAIANHKQFAAQVSNLGGIIKGVKNFSDHHIYTEKEIYDIVAKSKEITADIIVTTHKDFVKLNGFDSAKGGHIIYPDLAIKLSDEQQFLDILNK